MARHAILISVATLLLYATATNATDTVDAAREHVRRLGLYGKVSVDTFDGQRLPLIDSAAFEGRGEGLLLVASAADGKTLATRKLDAPPVWDGMAAAAGRLYVVDRKGQVVCLGESR